MPDNPLWRSLWAPAGTHGKTHPVRVPVRPEYMPIARPPKPHYRLGDTTAAAKRLAELRAMEALKLRLPIAKEDITPPEALASRWRSKHPVMFVPVAEEMPSVPALPGKRPEPAPAFRLFGNRCKWPFNHVGDDDFHFCKCARLPNRPYCADHVAKAYCGTARKVEFQEAAE